MYFNARLKIQTRNNSYVLFSLYNILLIKIVNTHATMDYQYESRKILSWITIKLNQPPSGSIDGKSIAGPIIIESNTLWGLEHILQLCWFHYRCHKVWQFFGTILGFSWLQWKARIWTLFWLRFIFWECLWHFWGFSCYGLLLVSNRTIASIECYIHCVHVCMLF